MKQTKFVLKLIFQTNQKVLPEILMSSKVSIGPKMSSVWETCHMWFSWWSCLFLWIWVCSWGSSRFCPKSWIESCTASRQLRNPKIRGIFCKFFFLLLSQFFECLYFSVKFLFFSLKSLEARGPDLLHGSVFLPSDPLPMLAPVLLITLTHLLPALQTSWEFSKLPSPTKTRQLAGPAELVKRCHLGEYDQLWDF